MAEQAEGPVPTLDELLACQVSSWYPLFATLPLDNELRRTKGTMQTRIVDLPPDFTEFMLTDGIQLPVGAKTSSFLDAAAGQRDGDNDDWSEDEHGTRDAPSATREFRFEELNQEINSAISDLGGSAMPKLNWSSPKDAMWVNGGSLECRTAGDVYLLLKSSDFCLYDAQEALKNATNDGVTPREPFKLKLALRKWCNLYPSQEFRCFVANKEIIAVSQRDPSQFFPHLLQERSSICDLILDFHDHLVQDRISLSNYVMDVYVDQKEKVWVLDFNVWGKQTDGLLFEWPELVQLAAELASGAASAEQDNGIASSQHVRPEFRLVETPQVMRSDPLAGYRVPIDTMHLATATAADDPSLFTGESGTGMSGEPFASFMKLCVRPSELDQAAAQESAQ